MLQAVEHLQQLGFSQYEAQAYVALLKQNPLNGYELAKVSGIPRPNIYPVLQKLEERGAVLRIDGQDGTRYSPLGPQELIGRLSGQFQACLSNAESALEKLSEPDAEAHIWSVRGYPEVLEHARGLIHSANEKLVLAVWPEEARQLTDDVRQAEARGVNIKTLCLAGCPHPCAACAGDVYRYQVAPQEDPSRWLVVVPDSSEMLAGEIRPDEAHIQEKLPVESSSAVRTEQKMLVNLSEGYIRRSIALAAILVDLGPKLDGLLTPQAKRLLNSLEVSTRDPDAGLGKLDEK